jgi:RNA polymerase sigma-70 factor (ECF subfamily)
MERIKASDPAALADLYDRHNGLVFGVVLRMLRNRDEAEEVLQDTFVQAWKHGNTYQPGLGSPAGWLVGIARNRAIDRLRAGAVRAAARDSVSADSGASALEGSARRGEQHIDIARALAALPFDERNLIEQAYFQGFTHSELAERHGIPLGTIKTRIRRGVQTLREYLKGRYIES